MAEQRELVEDTGATIAEQIAAYHRDDNEWWRLGSGVHQNMFDAVSEALGDLIDALSDEVRYEVGQSPHVCEQIDQACALLGKEYAGYIGKWNA